MKKVILTAAAAAALAIPAAAIAEPLLIVPDPTPNGMFSGTYECGEYDAEGNYQSETCDQTGYVAVYEDGVTACNGNEDYTRPDNGEPLQGYIWVGSGHAADDPAGQTPGGGAGAGNNTNGDDPNTAGNQSEGPCEEQP